MVTMVGCLASGIAKHTSEESRWRAQPAVCSSHMRGAKSLESNAVMTGRIMTRYGKQRLRSVPNTLCYMPKWTPKWTPKNGPPPRLVTIRHTPRQRPSRTQILFPKASRSELFSRDAAKFKWIIHPINTSRDVTIAVTVVVIFRLATLACISPSLLDAFGLPLRKRSSRGKLRTFVETFVKRVFDCFFPRSG